MRLPLILGLVCLLSADVHAGTVLITFNEFPQGTVVDTEYQSVGALFSVSSTNDAVIVDISADAAFPPTPVLSGPNALRIIDPPAWDDSLIVTFIDPTSGLPTTVTSASFSFVSDTAGVGEIRAYDSSNALIDSSTSVLGGAINDGMQSYETLSVAGSGITRIEIDGFADVLIDRLEFDLVTGCTLKVLPIWNQGDWPNVPLGHHPSSSGVTIGSDGCALSCLSMALRQAGVTGWQGMNNDPQQLNDLLRQRGGFDYPATLNWINATKTVRLASGKSIAFNTEHWGTNTIDNSADVARERLEELLCRDGLPVVVGVKIRQCFDRNGNRKICSGHFVLVTGIVNGEFTTADPNGGRTGTLSDYNNEFFITGRVVDPPPEPALTIGVVADVPNVDLLVVDPMGLATGYVPESRTLLSEIPGSAYYSAALENNLTGAPADEFSEQVPIQSAINGEYVIILAGEDPGRVYLTVGAFASDGTSQGSLTQIAVVGDATISEFRVAFDGEPGGIPTVRRAASISSTISDLNNGEALQEIDPRIAHALRVKLENAYDAKTAEAAAGMLTAFGNQVDAQTGKSISPELAEILLQDVEFILSGF